MRYALFDNSSLTAVQRILGGIKLRNKYVIDSDILALESYIQAILFYDTLVYIDDYKDHFRESRRSFFSNMHAYTPTKSFYNALLEKSKDLMEGIVPRVESGQMTDENFRPFLDLLKMNITFTWDMSNSVYYLTVKMLETVRGLDYDKYGKLASMIRQELVDKNVSSVKIDEQRPLLYDSKGNKIVFNDTYRDLADQTKSFFASLNWLAFRTFFYTLAAKELGMDLFLHHIRHSFQINSLYKMQIFEEPVYRALIETLNNKASETINKILSPTKPLILKYNLPMFSAWLAQETGDPKEFVKTAYEIRKSDIFVQARQQLIELEEALSRGNDAYLKHANQLVKDVEQQMRSISTKYKVNTPQGLALSPTVSIWNLSTLITKLPQIPEVNADLPFLELVRNLRPPRGFKAVYRKLLDDLTRVARLGEIYDIITSRIVYHDEADFYSPKFEPQEYYRRESYWKKLM